VTFFAWTTAHGKILTLDNLKRRGMVVVNRCWLCEADGQSVDHLLLHCRTARALWNAFLPGLAYVGLCLARLRSYLLVGGRVVVQGALLCEK
jgi:hypothetical protein